MNARAQHMMCVCVCVCVWAHQLAAQCRQMNEGMLADDAALGRTRLVLCPYSPCHARAGIAVWLGVGVYTHTTHTHTHTHTSTHILSGQVHVGRRAGVAVDSRHTF
jgi:hypothetical protein